MFFVKTIKRKLAEREWARKTPVEKELLRILSEGRRDHNALQAIREIMGLEDLEDRERLLRIGCVLFVRGEPGSENQML